MKMHLLTHTSLPPEGKDPLNEIEANLGLMGADHFDLMISLSQFNESWIRLQHVDGAANELNGARDGMRDSPEDRMKRWDDINKLTALRAEPESRVRLAVKNFILLAATICRVGDRTCQIISEARPIRDRIDIEAVESLRLAFKQSFPGLSQMRDWAAHGSELYAEPDKKKPELSGRDTHALPLEHATPMYGGEGKFNFQRVGPTITISRPARGGNPAGHFSLDISRATAERIAGMIRQLEQALSAFYHPAGGFIATTQNLEWDGI